MKYRLLFLFVAVAVSAHSQTVTRVPSKVYAWKAPDKMEARNLLSATIFSGGAQDMAYISMSACGLRPSTKKTKRAVPSDEEHLLIVKSGMLEVGFGDSLYRLNAGSIVLLMPGEKYSLRSAEPTRFYRMQYRSTKPADLQRGISSGGSFVRLWDSLPYRRHDRGGVRSYFERPTAMCRRFEMHVTTLNSDTKSHEPHTHPAEEIVLMMEDTAGNTGRTEMQIGKDFVRGEAGDLYFLGSNIPHAIKNVGEARCSYFAFQFE